MSALRAKRQILVLGVEPFEEGERFNKWPPHVTLVPWFSGASEERLQKGLKELTARTRPIAARIGEVAWFGSNKNVPVRIIEPNNHLQQLHLGALSRVHIARGNIEDISHISYRFRPHVTEYRGLELAEGYIFDQVALIDNAGGDNKRVAEVFALRG